MRGCGKPTATFATLLTMAALMGADQRAKTEDGRDVILREDGTWVYAEKRGELRAVGEFRKDEAATAQYRGKKWAFVLHYTPGTWTKLDESMIPDAEVMFMHEDQELMGAIIAERIQIPLDVLKRIAIENAMRVDENAEVTSEEERIVNGREVLCLTIVAKPEGIPITYYNYYYSGDEGVIQFMTWTGQNLFEEYKPDMETFLNGFEIIEK